MSCACNYAITTPLQCAFGILTQMEHHIPPQLNAVHSIRVNAKKNIAQISTPRTEPSNVDKLIRHDPIRLESVSAR